MWHLLAAIGQYFLAKIRKAAPKYAALDTLIGSALGATTDCVYCHAPGCNVEFTDCGHICTHYDCAKDYIEDKTLDRKACVLCGQKITKIKVIR